MRFFTAVVMSASSMTLSLLSILMIPPISAASSSPPKSSPLTSIPNDAMPMTGNSPFSSLWTSIWIPSIEPENVRPPIPWIPVTLADRVRTKLPGSEVGSPFGHWMPISLMWTGSQDGQAKLSPVAPPTERKMPKPGRALNEPLPRNSKLRASPPMSRPATASSALIEVKLTSGSVGPAPVLILRFSALRTRKAPNLTPRHCH